MSEDDMPPTNPQEYVANVEDQQLTEEELSMLKKIESETIFGT